MHDHVVHIEVKDLTAGGQGGEVMVRIKSSTLDDQHVPAAPEGLSGIDRLAPVPGLSGPDGADLPQKRVALLGPDGQAIRYDTHALVPLPLGLRR